MVNQPKRFLENQRIRVSREFTWARGETGVIIRPPYEVQMLASGWFDDCCRKIVTPRGEKIFYWVRFDLPQFDDLGDGPFSEVELSEDYIDAVAERQC